MNDRSDSLIVSCNNVMPTIIPKAQQSHMRWKNGGGTTREVLRFPQDSTIDSFDWRVSVAHVQRAGAFSRFPGIDRSLAIIDGAGIIIECAGNLHQLTPSSDIFSFEGETPIHSTLMDGSVVDFNVMTMREKYTHGSERLTLTDETREFHRRGEASLFYVVNGECSLVDTGAPLRLNAGDAFLLDHPTRHCILKAQHMQLMGVYLYRVANARIR